MHSPRARYLWLFPFLVWTAVATGHVETRQAVVVDSDMALDDVRALALLTCHEGVDLLACVTSDGACAPQSGAVNARIVLRQLGAVDVPVYAGRSLGVPAPPWRPMSEALGWTGWEIPDAAPSDAGASSLDQLARLLARHDRVHYLCLGPLTNLADLLTHHAEAAKHLTAIQYWGSAPGAPEPTWNTARDPGAARTVFTTASRAGIPIRALDLPDSLLLTYDADLAADVCRIEQPPARLLCELHSDDGVAALLRRDHFVCWDESAVLDLLFPDLFTWESVSGGELQLRGDLEHMRHIYLGLLSGDLSMKTGHRHAVTLRTLPVDRDQLRPDVAAIRDDALARHGREEWDAVLLTNELHRHLGIYSILGAKMGIRARELLDAGVDELEVVSLAGSEPPLSCMTDGLQVSTGATLGRGTISIEPGVRVPAARFCKGQRAVELRIRADVVARIRTDISSCIADHGALTPAYWNAVRALALTYWRDQDRADIFDVRWPEP